jgi:hypothetical protein
VNALSNAKRALDCQVICLLDIFGLLKIAESKRWGFPTKIEALSKIGILAPKILNKINKARNLLEHEFSNPNPDQVNDFIDIVTLFIESTRRYLDNYVNYIETSWINDKLINVEIIDDKIIVEIYYCENKNDESSKLEKIVVESNNENYYKLLDLFHKKTEGIY